MKVIAPVKSRKTLLHPKNSDVWQEVLGMWKDKKIDGLKYQRKIRSEWK